MKTGEGKAMLGPVPRIIKLGGGLACRNNSNMSTVRLVMGKSEGTAFIVMTFWSFGLF